MFCAYCKKDMGNEEAFCPYCGKAQPSIGNSAKSNSAGFPAQINGETASKQKVRQGSRLSDAAIKAIITVVAIVVLIVIVSVIYYPNLFPWNW